MQLNVAAPPVQRPASAGTHGLVPGSSFTLHPTSPTALRAHGNQSGSTGFPVSPASAGYPVSPALLGTSTVMSAPSSSTRLTVPATSSTPTTVFRGQPAPLQLPASGRPVTPVMTPTRLVATAPTKLTVAPVVSTSKVVLGASYQRLAQPQCVSMATAGHYQVGAPVVSTPSRLSVGEQSDTIGDPALMQLKELRGSSGLEHIHVSEALQELKGAAEEGQLRRDVFLSVYAAILERSGAQVPDAGVQNAVFDLFDRDENHVVDIFEVLFGISALCEGSESEKIDAVFRVVDENHDGYITLDEMTKFFGALFRVSVTPGMMEKMGSLDVELTSVEDLAFATAMDCLKAADISQDNRLSKAEFKMWLEAPRSDPGHPFAPLRKALA